MTNYSEQELSDTLKFISNIKISVASDDNMRNIPIMPREDEASIFLEEDDKRVLFGFC